MKTVAQFLILLIIISSCNSENSGSELDKELENLVEKTDNLKEDLGDLEDDDDAFGDEDDFFGEMTTDELIESIPSPLEMTALIRNSGASFSETFLNNPDKRNDYNSNPKKALNLGVYGADLGYINIYEKTHLSTNYIGAVKGLADDLNIGQFFDFETLRRLSKSNANIDSIVYISTTGFEKMDKYLRGKGRSNVSVLLIFGGWIEGLHIATGVAENAKDGGKKEIMETIYDENIILADLITLLGKFGNQPMFAELKQKSEALQLVFDSVEIEEEEGEITQNEVDGVVKVTSTGSSSVVISDKKFEEIKKAVGELRNLIIS